MGLNEDYKNIDLNNFKENGLSLDSNDEPKSTKNSKNKESAKTAEKRSADHSGSKKKLFMWFAIIVIVVIGISIYTNNKLNSGKISNASPDSKTVSGFRTSVSPYVSAQDNKQKLNESWRKATITYSKDNNKDNFKKELNTINNSRITSLNNIKDTNSDLGKIVVSSLNDMQSSLQSAYNASDSNDAINIYNKWNSKDKESNKKYINTFIDVLKKNKINYKVKNNSNNGATIDY